MSIAEDGNVSDNDTTVGNPAMADAMRKVLSIGKNSGKTKLVLAKAKVLPKHGTEEKPSKGPGFEIEPDGEIKEERLEAEVKNEDGTTSKLLKRKRVKKQDVVGRVKPSPLDREKERPLMKLATKGVVQLFNAVREQQKVVSKKLKEAGPSVIKKERALKSIDKKSFLNVLRGCADGNQASRLSPEKEIKTEDEEDANEESEQPSWGVLRDDFMIGGKMKDWDKKVDETPPPGKHKKQKTRR